MSTGIVRLAAGDLRATVDPARGAVVSSLSLRQVELLYQAPWAPGPLPGREDETGWVEAWRGGWNLLAPNAGAACEVAGRRHPFHGDASRRPWQVVDSGPDAVTLRHADVSGITLERRLALDAGGVSATTTAVNEGRDEAAIVAVEHLVLGGAVVAPSTVVELEGGPLVPLDDTGPPLADAAACAPWPHAHRGRGEEDWSRRPAGAAARYGAVPRPAAGVRVRAPAASAVLLLTWAASLPWLWFWEEAHATVDAPWHAGVRCLALEPACCSTGEGLEAATRRGEAVVLAPGEAWRSQVRLDVVPA